MPLPEICFPKQSSNLAADGTGSFRTIAPRTLP